MRRFLVLTFGCLAAAGCEPAAEANSDASAGYGMAVEGAYRGTGLSPPAAPYEPNAYGLGMGMDRYGRPVPHDPNIRLQPNAYGLGMGMDQYGRPVPHGL